MTRSTRTIAGLLALSLAACGGADAPASEDTATPDSSTNEAALETQTAPPTAFAEVSSGDYALEKSHASLLWKISHNDLSWYTARFAEFDASLAFDASNPSASSVTVTIDPTSVRTDHPDGDEWDIELANGEKFFNASVHPSITFQSTDLTATGETTGLITGDLTLLGATLPVTLEASFNGVANPPWYNGRDVIGFSATATIKRSDFGMDTLIPNIGDEVQVIIEAEFLESES